MVKDITPTVGIEITRNFQEFLEHGFLILDFGGQLAYREQHVVQEDNWKEISALIFVFDIQDTESYQAASDYLSEIWEIISRVNEKIPRLSIFLHKYDLDKRKDLDRTIFQCLVTFKPFFNIASFYLTTIEDSSSNIALIKAFYFSLPDIMLKKLLEEEFMAHFEKVSTDWVW